MPSEISIIKSEIWNLEKQIVTELNLSKLLGSWYSGPLNTLKRRLSELYAKETEIEREKSRCLT